jgi:hypothetical protein
MALGGTDVSEERIASIIRVKRISEIGTTLAMPEFSSTLRSVPSWLHGFSYLPVVLV